MFRAFGGVLLDVGSLQHAPNLYRLENASGIPPKHSSCVVQRCNDVEYEYAFAEVSRFLPFSPKGIGINVFCFWLLLSDRLSIGFPLLVGSRFQAL